MNALDWIFIAALAVGIVLGLIKGFLKPLFSILGLVVVTMGTSFLSPVVQGWMMTAKMSDSIRSLMAVIISAFILLILTSFPSLYLTPQSCPMLSHLVPTYGQ